MSTNAFTLQQDRNIRRFASQPGVGIRVRALALAMFVIAGLLAQVSYAQGPGMPPPGGFGHRGPGGPGGPGDGMIAFEGLMGHLGGKVITGAPFTAVVTSEHVEKLADGNTIDNKSTSNVSRDSSGRTRRDLNLPMGMGPFAAAGQPEQLVSISDPVAQKHILLNVTKKTYQEFSIPARPNSPSPGDGEHMRGGMRDGMGTPTTESLGQKSLEGLTVQGTRVTRTIPAGAFGNANPIVIVSERWYSPDLQLTVLETRSDPRFGTSTFQLTSINRNEPAASLFAVPSDYTVQQRREFRRGPRGAGKMPPPPGAPGEGPQD